MNLTKIADLVGMAGIVLFYPLQNAQLFMTRDATGLSLPAFVSLLFGTVGFTVLGAKLRKPGLMIANGIAVVFTAALIVGIVLW